MSPGPTTRTNGSRHAREAALTATVHVLLFALLFVVLLPLLWMLVTAFKQRGLGMSLNVLPATTVHVETEPVILGAPEGASVSVTFELADPDRARGTVTVAGPFNGWDSDATPLRWRFGVWTASVSGFDPGDWPYKFIIDGEWTADPAAEQFDGDGNSLITVGDSSTSNLDPPSDASRVEDGQLVIDFLAPGIDRLRAELHDPATQRWLDADLLREGDRWVGEMSLPEISGEGQVTLQRRVTYDMPFGEAWRRTYTLGNFTTILRDENYPFGLFFLNSLVVATGAGLITSILCLLAGYAFAVKEFWGRDPLFWFLFSSMLIPGLVFVVPQFSIVSSLGWRNSYQGMILPHVANVFGLFLMRQYIMTMPRDLFSAARVDGASELQVLRSVVVPLSMPIIVTLFLLTFMMQWSNFLWQLIVNSPDSAFRTLPVGLALFRGQHQVDWELMMAGACFSVVPIALLFIAAQRFFIQGLTAGAVKG